MRGGKVVLGGIFGRTVQNVTFNGQKKHILLTAAICGPYEMVMRVTTGPCGYEITVKREPCFECCHVIGDE